MKSRVGMFITNADNGGTLTNKVFKYSSYQEMVADPQPGQYGIVDNTVYHKTVDGWVVGFPNVTNEKDYTAFEVFANDQVIPVGYSVELGGEVHEEIPIGMTHKFIIRGSTPQDQQDVVVDWGDGTIVSLNEITPSSALPDTKYTSGSYSTLYAMEHTYSTPGKYVVRVFGTTYKHIQYDDKADDGQQCNLICRIFDADLPIASHLDNFDSLCCYAKRLLSLNLSGCGGSRFLAAYNVYMTFAFCTNLVEAIGFNRYAKFKIISGVFQACTNLTTTDFVIPQWCINCTGAFYNCSSLVADIAKILPPDCGFTGTTVNIGRTFAYGKKLYGTIPADKLWDSKTVEFIGNGTQLSQVFLKCSDAIRAQAPAAWGGTKQ